MSTKPTTTTATKSKTPDAILPTFEPAPPVEQVQTLVMRPIEIASLDELARVAGFIAKSGIFKDSTTAERAATKILLGMELGIGPLAAMRGISFNDRGEITLSANLQAGLVQRSGRYNFYVAEHTGTRCEIGWYERTGKDKWTQIGTTSLTIEEAKEAGMHMQAKSGGGSEAKYTWLKFPSDMLFARCITRGIKRFCPSVTNGVTLYDPDELQLPEGTLQNAQVITHADNTAQAQAMEGKAVAVAPTPAPTNATSAPTTTGTTTGAGSTTETAPIAPQTASGEGRGATTETGTTTSTTSKQAAPTPPTRDEAIKIWQRWAGKVRTTIEGGTYTEKNDWLSNVQKMNRAQNNDEAPVILQKAITLRNAVCGITGEARDFIYGDE